MRISDWSSDVCSSDLLFGDAAAETEREARLHLLHILRIAVALGPVPRHAQGAATRADRDLVQRVIMFDVERDERVAGLVIAGRLLLVLGHHPRAAFGPHHYLVLGFLELVRGDQSVAPARQRAVAGTPPPPPP